MASFWFLYSVFFSPVVYGFNNSNSSSLAISLIVLCLWSNTCLIPTWASVTNEDFLRTVGAFAMPLTIESFMSSAIVLSSSGLLILLFTIILIFLPLDFCPSRPFSGGSTNNIVWPLVSLALPRKNILPL